MIRLLDVCVLISLLDANHEHHTKVKNWWDRNEDIWASCPTTQNGYLRIVTMQQYPNQLSTTAAIQKLNDTISKTNHKFLHEDISLLDDQYFLHQNIQGPKQMTDIYLLALSIKHDAQFVTTDHHIDLNPVINATEESLHLI